jgi:hypothetical protein
MRFFQGRSLLDLLAIGYILLLGVSPGEVGAADWKERLLSEAPSKWAALEQYYAQMEVSFRKIYTTTPKSSGSFPPQFPDVAHFDIRKNGDLMVSTLRRTGKWPDGKRMDGLNVYGINSRYAFELGKTSPNDDSFLLADFQRASDEIRRKVHAHGEHGFGFAFEVNGESLSKFIKDPNVTILDVRGVQRDGREMAQMEYTQQLKKRDQQNGVEHGSVVLDPEHFWCVREYHSDLPDNNFDGIVEYGEDVDGFPILRREQDTTTYKDGMFTGKLVITYEFDNLVHRDIPESEFTLSAFDLPEMQLPGEQKPPTLWRWLISIGIAFSVMAVLLRVYMKKKRQAIQHV